MKRNTFVVIAVVTATAIGISVVLSGCATTSMTLPTAAQLTASGAVPAGTDTQALRRGRALAVTECAGCHRFYWPGEHTAEQWPSIVRKMGNLASLNRRQIEDMELYFLAASQRQEE